jgi:hypothetical protein
MDGVIQFLSANEALIATVISIVALMFAILRDFILPRIFHPKIGLEGLNDQGCINDIVTLPPFAGNSTKSRWLRLRIRNGGYFAVPARNCYVKLLQIKNPENTIISPFNPSLLTWVGYERTYANLANNEEHYIYLIYEYEEWPWFYLAKIEIPSAFECESAFREAGIYTFKVGVYGDNINGKEYEFRIRLTGKWNELKFD